MNKFIYNMTHEYFIEEGVISMKEIGTFSSAEKANEAIDISIKLNGFKNHPRDCYKIRKVQLDDISRWETGFNEDELIQIR